MKQYKYTAINLNKEKITGTFLAENERELAKELAKQNLFLVSCSVYKGGTPSAFFTLGTGKVGMSELTVFCRQLAIMLDAGISILESLECLKEQAYTAYFKSLLEVIYDDVKSGVLLSDALDKHNNVFPEFFRSMIAVGEASGKLNIVLNALADYYERDQAIKKKTKSALSYPIILAIMALGIVILMLVFIVPTFRSSLSSLEVEITGITKAVYDISDFVLKAWPFFVVGIILIIGGLWGFLRTDYGKKVFDKFKLSAPLVKTITLDLITARFASAFSLLLSSGLDISECLDSSKVVLGNSDETERFIKASEEIKHGSKIAVAFEKYKLFPQMMLQMIGVGERTASLENVLNRTRAFFDDQVETSLTSLTSKIQPVMLIIIGAIVALMFIAVYSPMISIMTSLAV